MEGLTVYNDDMRLQIDSNYIDVSLVSKTMIGSGQQPSISDDSITAFSINDGGFVAPVNYSGNGIVYSFNSEPILKSPSGLGLELYGENGDVYYSSKNKSIKVIDRIFIGSDELGSSFSWSKSYHSGVAILPCSVPIYLSSTQGITYFRAIRFIRNGTIISAEWGLFNNRPYQNSDGVLQRTKASNLEFLVIDASHY